jgi:hypothetical protein
MKLLVYLIILFILLIFEINLGIDIVKDIRRKYGKHEV